MDYLHILNTLVVIVFTILYFNTQSGKACSCVREHPAETFCASDFVIKAKVKRMKMVNVEDYIEVNGKNVTYDVRIRQYGVKISKIYKVAPGFEVGKYVLLHSAEHDSLCGVTMRNETMYVIQGHVNADGSIPKINLCKSPLEWNRLPESMRKGFRYLYKKSCGCKVGRCYEPDCGLKEQGKGFCQNYHGDNMDQCFREHAVCLNDGTGMCKWSTRALFKKCTKESQNPDSSGFDWEP